MMKVVLCFAFVCCFVAGALAAGCGCDEGMMDCACKPANKNIIKAKVDGEPFYYGSPLGNGLVYKIKQKNYYKGGDMNFKRVYVSDDCDKPLKDGEIYILMGQYKGNKDDGKKILELHAVNNWVKYHENLEDVQMKKLRQLKNGVYEC